MAHLLDTDDAKRRTQLKIFVSEPTKVSETLPPSTYVTYKIVTSEMPKGSVVRKFTDFEWLAEQLTLTVPGSIVPAVPEIQKVGRFDTDFVDTKRRQLEKFLNRIAVHTELSKSPLFDVFLYGNDTAFQQAKSRSAPPLSSKAAAWVEDNLSKVMIGGKKAEDKTPKDLEFDTIAEAMARWETLIIATSKSASALTKNTAEVSKGYADLADALGKLGKEEGAAPLGGSVKATALCLNEYATMVAARKDREVELLEEPSQEYTDLVTSVQSALGLREDARLAYLAAKASTAALQADYAKLTSGVDKEGQKVRSKLEAIEKAQIAEHTTKVRLERISDDLLIEYERFKSEKAADLTAMLVEFTKAQIEFHRKAIVLLDGTLPRMTVSAPEEREAGATRVFQAGELRELGAVEESSVTPEEK